jgi:hypothetical protein
MKSRKPLLYIFSAGMLLFGSNLIAQDAPPPPPPAEPAMPAPPTPPAPPAAATSSAMPAAPMPEQGTNTAAGQTASGQTPQGELTVHSAPAPAPTIGPAPSFEQLSGGGKAITEDQAIAYLPLANDFINADSNRNGSVSKAEYERWTKQL